MNKLYAVLFAVVSGLSYSVVSASDTDLPKNSWAKLQHKQNVYVSLSAIPEAARQQIPAGAVFNEYYRSKKGNFTRYDWNQKGLAKKNITKAKYDFSKSVSSDMSSNTFSPTIVIDADKHFWGTFGFGAACGGLGALAAVALLKVINK